ncbi:MAG: 2-isopropylmalate synthase [Sandaracinaceae bacterium]|jgi:2-isopropylmalate synthase|nr:2-isopropylmalate synthase [Sandaracinaceae bacterium]
MGAEVSDLIYDWNAVERRSAVAMRGVSLLDETLRDGIQNPSVVDPKISDKLEILHLLDELGVEYADVGLPGSSPRAFDDVLRIAKEVVDCKMKIRLGCAGRTVVSDIAPMVEVSQRAGIPIEVMTFIGSSPIRAIAEDWSVELIRNRSIEAIDFGVKNNLPVTYVTEDTTRSKPEVLRELFVAAIDHGATRLCLCDTVGHATPDGVRNLVQFTRKIVAEKGVEGQVLVDWHGHNDRGLALENALWAFEFGADRVHGTILGIGERVGNAPLDLMLLNLKLLGELGDRDLSKLYEICQVVSRATQFPIPINYPAVGDDAFRTGTGVHAAAIIKAQAKGDAWLADRIYSGVPASMFGREQEITIGPMSGLSNVQYWLRRRGHEVSQDLCEHIIKVAKQSDHMLTNDQVNAIRDAHLASRKS